MRNGSAKTEKIRDCSLSSSADWRPLQQEFQVVGFGELLWDTLPEGRQLGGARANIAYFSGLLGDRGIITSRVGTDILGEVARDRIEVLGLRPPPCKVMPLI
jgi:hypothetical protein